MTRIAQAALVLLALSSAGNIATTAAQDQPAAVINWRSTAGNAQVMASEFDRLYLSLYNTGNLAVREVANPDGLFVETLMRRERLFKGAYFPIGLDNMLCDLNRRVCKRERPPASEKALSDITAHVGGFQITQPIWLFGKGDTLLLPDYLFTPYTTLEKIAVPKDWTPEKYRPDEDVSCQSWGVDCETVVRHVNPTPLKSAQMNVSSAVLPVAGFETWVPLQADDKTKYREALTKFGAGVEAGKTAFVGQQSLEFQSQWEEMLKRESAADLTIQAIDRNILSVGSGARYATSGEPSFPDQRDLFNLIGHPFGQNEELALPYRSPVEILVVDDEFDPLHCDLPQPDGAATVDAPDGECGQIASPAHPIFDHATHVIGLISAPMNKKGMLGLNPNAKVSHEKVNLQFSSSADILDLMSMLFMRAVEQKARVINMSWSFEPDVGRGGELEAGIIAFDRIALIVAAAGNDGEDLTDDCRILPACFLDLDNVITVVGLNRDLVNPALWAEGQEGSNSSRDFHIAAIAESVLSTVRDNKLGRLSGTSQAVPQVAATASLIISAVEFINQDEIAETDGKIPPKVVKQRLMYTADLFPALRAKVQSGRLNVDRAINIVDTQVELRQTDGSPKKLAGTLIKIPNDILQCLKPSGGAIDHSWGSIRRLAYEPFAKRYTIFKNARSDDRFSDLERIDGCNMTTLSHKGKLRLDDGSEEEFEMGNILDYTSPMLQ